jgi:hypothetical protein
VIGSRVSQMRRDTGHPISSRFRTSSGPLALFLKKSFILGIERRVPQVSPHLRDLGFRHWLINQYPAHAAFGPWERIPYFGSRPQERHRRDSRVSQMRRDTGHPISSRFGTSSGPFALFLKERFILGMERRVPQVSPHLRDLGFRHWLINQYPAHAAFGT